ncbi:MAG TPA: CheR family methyltransferase [Thermoanaerobaculia bacterium]|jgi:chemotaxis protein methyltransferase CheR|nr:CheR family methyltransferase [Thermoanaerobaculia bacterium]
MIQPQPEDASPVLRLVALIRETTGNVIPPARMAFLEEVAERRAHARGLAGVEAYVHALVARELADEWESLIPLVTIKESYFFRAPQQFDVIRQRILPALVKARSATRQLRIWSAACARGEEPATLAMLLAEEPTLAGWSWTITATDVDEEALAGARIGLYGERAVSQVPPALLERWFSRRGKLYELDAGLRSRVVYQRLNLAHAPFVLPYEEFDLVLMRNVLIYFRRPLQRWVISQVARVLTPEGYLFLGASETLWQIQDELESVDLGPCFAYRHRGARPAGEEGVEAPARRSRVARPASPGASPQPAQPEPPLASPPKPRAPVRAPAPPPVTEAPPPALPSVHELLLAAARDLAANRTAEATRGVEQALAADPSEPSAHALEGFLHDLAGRTEDAITAYRAALYLDPALFQVRVLLGDCLLRLGHGDRAEQQFREVLTLLASGRERALVLFSDLPFPERERAQRRARQVLKGK